MEDQEIMNVTVEAVEEEETEELEDTGVSAVTVIEPQVVDVLANITARRDVKSRKKTPYYYGLVVLMYALAAYWAYTRYVTKTGSRGIVIIAMMLIMATILLRYLRTPPEMVAKARMQPYLGQHWHYRFDDEGIHNSINNGPEGVFEWDEVTCWWEEEGYLILEVGGQHIAIKLEDLDEDELEELKSLCWVYLGEQRKDNVK